MAWDPGNDGEEQEVDVTAFGDTERKILVYMWSDRWGEWRYVATRREPFEPADAMTGLTA